MRVEVLLFAQLRESLGTDRSTLDVEEGLTVRDLANRLLAKTKRSDLGSLPLRFAINEELVDADRKLSEGDRVAILTPVSGG